MGYKLSPVPSNKHKVNITVYYRAFSIANVGLSEQQAVGDKYIWAETAEGKEESISFFCLRLHLRWI